MHYSLRTLVDSFIACLEGDSPAGLPEFCRDKGFARQALRTLSERDFGDDPAAWRAWFDTCDMEIVAARHEAYKKRFFPGGFDELPPWRRVSLAKHEPPRAGG